MQPDVENLRLVADRLAAALATHYVFREVGVRGADAVRRRVRAAPESHGGESLAAALTDWARQALDDPHVRVIYCADGAPDPATAQAQFQASFRAKAAAESYGIARVEVLAGGIGLLELTNFFDATVAGEAMVRAMRRLADCRALVIDLRRNGGGEPGSVALLCSYLFPGDPERTHLNDLLMPDGSWQQWWTLPYVPGSRLDATAPVYVLTSGRTFSAAEECAYDLQVLGRALVVGEVSRGGAHTVEQFRLTRHFAALIPSGRARNPVTGGNWQGVGVRPDLPCAAEAAVEIALAHARERLLPRAGG